MKCHVLSLAYFIYYQCIFYAFVLLWNLAQTLNTCYLRRCNCAIISTAGFLVLLALIALAYAGR